MERQEDARSYGICLALSSWHAGQLHTRCQWDYRTPPHKPLITFPFTCSCLSMRFDLRVEFAQAIIPPLSLVTDRSPMEKWNMQRPFSTADAPVDETRFQGWCKRHRSCEHPVLTLKYRYPCSHDCRVNLLFSCSCVAFFFTWPAYVILTVDCANQHQV